MDRALRNEPGGAECVELMLNANAVIALAVGYKGRWLSDCDCHSEVQLTKSSYQGRRRMLEKMRLADGLCIWGGRRGVPLASGAVDELVGNFSNADSESYREAMVAANAQLAHCSSGPSCPDRARSQAEGAVEDGPQLPVQ